MLSVPHRHPDSGSADHRPGSDGAALCPWCGYDLSGIGENTCPECGRQFGPAEVAAVAARQRLVASAPRIWMRFIGVPLAAGALLFIMMLAAGASVAAALSVLPIAIALPILTAIAAAPVVLFSRPWERSAVMLAWMRHAVWLLLGWLALPALAALAWLALELFGRSAPTGPDPLVLSLIVVVPPWATVILTGVLAWAGAWFESERHIKHRPSVRAIAVFFGAGVVLLGAASAAVATAIMLSVSIWGVA